METAAAAIVKGAKEEGEKSRQGDGAEGYTADGRAEGGEGRGMV